MRPSRRLAHPNRLTSALRLLSVAVVAILAGTTVVSAHPMGNFSINHYAALTVEPGAVQVLYVIDMAEIPTFQELGDLNAAHSAALSPARRAAYLTGKSRGLAAGLSLSLGGHLLRLSVRAADLLFPPGAGGLPTERVYLVLRAPLPAGTGARGTLAFQDANFPDRAGWKEIVATSAAGATLSASSVPATSRSAALTVYPSNATTSPPQDVSATMDVNTAPASASRAAGPLEGVGPMAVIRAAEAPLVGPGGAWSPLAQRLAVKGPTSAGASTTAGPAASSWAQGRMDALTALIARRDLPPTTLLFSLLIAALLGALHAFSPGHGKTVVAAYIVGSRATARHAALLGLTVTATHTIGVFALGLVTLLLSHYVVPDRLYPWLGAISGLCIVVIGVALLVQRLAALRRFDTSAGHVYAHTADDSAFQSHADDGYADHVHLGHVHDDHADHVHFPDGRIVPAPAAPDDLRGTDDHHMSERTRGHDRHTHDHAHDHSHHERDHRRGDGQEEDRYAALGK